MTVAEIKAQVARAAKGHDPEAVFAAFRLESGSENPERFLSYLQREGVLDDATFRDLHANDEIDATEILSEPGAVGSATRGANESSGPGATGALGGRVSSSRNRYVVLGTAGRGGMGTVHVAKDMDLLRKVALKELAPGMSRSEEVLGRFVKEVRITAQLDHPHIVPVYSLEVSADGTPGYTMKLVHGKTFRDLIEETRAFYQAGKVSDAEHSLPSRLEHFLKVCDAMAYAHGKGVLHRDLKPPNLMLGRYNEVYVMDWGLCALIPGGPARGTPGSDDVSLVSAAGSPGLSDSHDGTRLGTVVGTPRYMSPEQAAGKNRELDSRSDQYSLGLILYELVALQPAMDGESVMELVRRATLGDRRPLAHAFGERIRTELAAIVDKATARRPEDRYESVSALADDVRRYLRGEAVVARPDTPWQRLARAMARHRTATLVTMLAVVAVSALAVLGTLYHKQRVLKTQREHELRLMELEQATGARGDRVQTHFLNLQARLTGFSAAIVHALTRGLPLREPYFTVADFKDPKRAPKDLTNDPRYDGNVSLQWPIWLIAKGVPPAVAESSIQRLTSLRHFTRRMFVELQASLDSEAASTATRTRTPLLQTMFGLESGVACFYPGSDVFPDEYEPRERPWYRLGASAKGATWGSPYKSLAGGALVLPCSTPLRGEDGNLLGVAGVLMTFDYLEGTLLQMPEAPAVIETLLLDEKGRIVISAPRRSPGAPPRKTPGDPTSAHQGLDLLSFPLPAVREAAQAGKSGTLETVYQGRPAIVAYDAIHPMGFSYVAIADREELLGNLPGR